MTSSRDPRPSPKAGDLRTPRKGAPGPGEDRRADEPRAGFRSRPWTVAVTSALCGLESVAVLIAAVLFAIQIGEPGVLSVSGRIFLLVLMLGGCVFIGAVAIKHLAGRAWTRAAVVVWQLFQIILSGQYLFGGSVLTGLAMLAPAAIALVLVFSPSTRAYLDADDAPRGA